MPERSFPTAGEVAAALNVENLKLPDGFLINDMATEVGEGKAIVVFHGPAPDEVVNTWTDKAGYDHDETAPSWWSFRVTIDLIGRD